MFITPLRLEATAPGRWRLLEPLIWKEEGGAIIVPRGFETDLASIPRTFRWLLQQNGNSRRPAVLHDWLYHNHIMSRSDADAMFKRALDYERVNKIGAYLYWAGVRVGGWLAYGR